MTEVASLVLFANDAECTGAFYRAVGPDLEHEYHDGGPAHYGMELGPGQEQMPWGCRVVFEDPDGRPVEINQRGHCT